VDDLCGRERRALWRRALEAEVDKWEAKSVEELIQELAEVQAYQIEFESREMQAEVEILEDTPQYLHVYVAVDDGVLPLAIRPQATTFIRRKTSASE
jgi:hypothetical protein